MTTAPPAGGAPGTGPPGGRLDVPAGAGVPDDVEPPVLEPVVQVASGGRLRVGQWVVVVATGVAVVVLGILVAGVVTVHQSVSARGELVHAIDPSVDAAHRLAAALHAQQTAARAGLADAYTRARADQDDAQRRLAASLPDEARLRADLARVRRAADTWHGTVEPVTAARPGRAGDFTPVDEALSTQQDHLGERRDEALRGVGHRADMLYAWLGVAAASLLAACVLAVAALRRMVVRPLAQLSEQVDRVTQGEFAGTLRVRGPAEIVTLAEGVDAMRRRIVREWTEATQARELLHEQAAELRRSNAELEQFAYVASHDLQEPLRKVASFCQMLERRYRSQLDDRAVQYIDFAVDGARRMQALINDLLSFSRVGRVQADRTTVDCEAVLRQALDDLALAREESGAEVTWDPMPTLPGDPVLVNQLFVNLVGNAIKFRGDEPPRVHLGVRREGDHWLFCCSDNGIGIEPEYADRIFLVFQRLHPRGTYTGTGIGLAMCKKIVEYHGGRIWLETGGSDAPDAAGAATGTTICWTMPAGDDDPQAGAAAVPGDGSTAGDGDAPGGDGTGPPAGSGGDTDHDPAGAAATHHDDRPEGFR